MTDSCAFALSDAAYVLGALPPAERLAYERHLTGCPTCAESVRRLAGVPGLLGRVSMDDVEGVRPIEPLPESVLPSLVRVVRRERRRRGALLAVAGVAATVVVAAGATTLQASRDDGRTPVAAPTSAAPSLAPARPMAAVGDDGIRADVALTSVAWGTKVDLTCTYGAKGEGYESPEGTHYSLVIRSRSGVEQVASWKSLPGKTLHMSGSSAATTDDITSVEVLTDSGRTVLRLGL